jgi:hypothetical protein
MKKHVFREAWAFQDDEELHAGGNVPLIAVYLPPVIQHSTLTEEFVHLFEGQPNFKKLGGKLRRVETMRSDADVFHGAMPLGSEEQKCFWQEQGFVVGKVEPSGVFLHQGKSTGTSF